MKSELTIVIIAVSFWCAGIVAAPLVDGMHLLYDFYSSVCHQFASRSFKLSGHPLAVCARCSGIYAGFLLGLVAVRFVPAMEERKFHPILLMGIAVIPMALSVVAEFAVSVPVSNLFRALTGLWCGAGLSLLLHRSLSESLRLLFQLPQRKL